SPRGSTPARPNENRYRDAELWKASIAAVRLINSRIRMMSVNTDPRYSVDSENSRSPSSRCAAAVDWACDTPVARTTAYVVNARMIPIAQIAVYVARGIVRNARLASSPNNAVASNPRKPVAANNIPIANDPDPNTEWTLNASIRNPVRNSTAKSNTNKTSTSSTSATPSTRALKSTPERAKRKHTSNDNRPHRYQCMVKPVMSAITVCRKK